MDRVTQQNASLVEESASASAALEEQASLLTQSVAVFTLGKHQISGSRPGTASTRAPLLTPNLSGARQTESNLSENWETF
jgi:methyl-accepting chemotaxis protein-1 (serine sensor receptor)